MEGYGYLQNYTILRKKCLNWNAIKDPRLIKNGPKNKLCVAFGIATHAVHLQLYRWQKDSDIFWHGIMVMYFKNHHSIHGLHACSYLMHSYKVILTSSIYSTAHHEQFTVLSTVYRRYLYPCLPANCRHVCHSNWSAGGRARNV